MHLGAKQRITKSKDSEGTGCSTLSLSWPEDGSLCAMRVEPKFSTWIFLLSPLF